MTKTKTKAKPLFAVVQSRANQREYLVHREADQAFLERTFTLMEAMEVGKELTRAATDLALSRMRKRHAFPSQGALLRASLDVDLMQALRLALSDETTKLKPLVESSQKPAQGKNHHVAGHVPVRATKLSHAEYAATYGDAAAWEYQLTQHTKALAGCEFMSREWMRIDLLRSNAENQLRIANEKAAA